jgi:hypothetical protein
MNEEFGNIWKKILVEISKTLFGHCPLSEV